MKQPIRQARHQVTVNIGGQSYDLRASFGALADIEAALELEYLGEISARLARPKIEELMIVFQLLVRAGGGDISEADMRDFSPLEISVMTQAIAQAMEAGFGQNSNDAVKKKA